MADLSINKNYTVEIAGTAPKDDIARHLRVIAHMLHEFTDEELADSSEVPKIYEYESLTITIKLTDKNGDRGS